jgi:hypothetical protein
MVCQTPYPQAMSPPPMIRSGKCHHPPGFPADMQGHHSGEDRELDESS